MADGAASRWRPNSTRPLGVFMPLPVPASTFSWLLPSTVILFLTTPQSKWLPAPRMDTLHLPGSYALPSQLPVPGAPGAQFYTFLLGLVLGCEQYRGYVMDTAHELLCALKQGLRTFSGGAAVSSLIQILLALPLAAGPLELTTGFGFLEINCHHLFLLQTHPN